VESRRPRNFGDELYENRNWKHGGIKKNRGEARWAVGIGYVARRVKGRMVGLASCKPADALVDFSSSLVIFFSYDSVQRIKLAS